MANMHEDDSSLGIKNLDYLKRKLFETEIDIIIKRIDDKCKEVELKFEEEKKKYATDYDILYQKQEAALEAFALEIDSFSKKMIV